MFESHFNSSYPAKNINEYQAFYCLMLYLLIVLPIFVLFGFGGDGGTQECSHMLRKISKISDVSNNDDVTIHCVSCVTVTGKHGSNYRLSLSCNRKSKKLNLTNLFNSQQ